MGCYPIAVEVGSVVVLNWLLKEELRPRKLQMLLQIIESKRQRGCNLSFKRAEQSGNEMAYALAVAGLSRAETFKAWW